MATPARYDLIGTNYSTFRTTDPTWLAEIDHALGDAKRVLNVGAGTGNYEQVNRDVVALEPSAVMIAQRDPATSPVVQGVAEALPFADDTFDAVMGVLTMHHWFDRNAGLREAARVAPRQVFTIYDTNPMHQFWLLDYFPELADTDLERNAPNAASIAEVLDVVEERVLWVDRDCRDSFGGASWARPEEYLDPARQQAMSMFAMADADVVDRGCAALRRDLDSGAWHHRHADLLANERADFGYRMVVARRP